MRKAFLFFLLLPFLASSQEFLTPYEVHGKNYSATYDECINFYADLAKTYSSIKLMEMGETDAGKPLHLVLLNTQGMFNPKKWHRNKHIVVLINNGIHPGEPDGIDASMLLARDVAQRMDRGDFPKEISIAIIPVYNIGGMLQRSPYYRVDQNGPEEFGSRGNSQNFDLNRDFIKCDSKEARSFAELFHFVSPHIFLDNHVSDGADYSYVMTLASTQPDKLGGLMGPYLKEKMEPILFQKMKEKGFPMMYFVNAWGDDAAKGWNQFFDSPRYSSGYTALFNTLSFVPETHMLKPYDQRVAATYTLMQCMLDYAEEHRNELLQLRERADANLQTQTRFPVSWGLDENKVDSITYAGYTYEKINSDVSGLPFYGYNRSKPFEKKIPFHQTYIPQVILDAPEAYLIPQGWHKVLALLNLNQVNMVQLDMDTVLDMDVYYIRSYTSTDKPYEGHHPNSAVKLESRREKITCRKGDFIIPLNQPAKRFLVETLEPDGTDSYFTWNFFDPILNQKEGFTPYAFESFAANYLKEHPDLKERLEEKKKTDTLFAQDTYKQLDFIYRNSPYAEPQFQRYPVYRLTQSSYHAIQPAKSPKNKMDE